MTASKDVDVLGAFIERLLAAEGLRVAVRELRGDDVVLVADGLQTAALIGRTPDELRGRSISDLGLPEPATEQCKALLARVASSGAAATVPIVVDTDAGSRHLLCTAVPLPGEPARQVLFVEELADEQDVAVAAMVHELANPLIAATASLALVERRLQAGATGAEVLPLVADARAAATRASEVLTTMRSLAYPDELTVTATIAELVGEALESVAGSITIAGPLPEARVLSGRTAARQVLVNLLRNAIQANERAGVRTPVRLAAAVSSDGREATITVTDDGPGLDAGIANRLFEAFATARPGGTGLGLFISRALAARLGGRVTVRDRTDGSGVVAALVLSLC